MRLLLLVTLALSLQAQSELVMVGAGGPSSSHTLPAFVNQTSANSCLWSSGTSFNCTITAPSTSNVLIVMCYVNHTSSISCSTPTGYTGATWTSLTTTGGQLHSAAIFCATLTASHTAITINLSTTPGTNAAAQVIEFSGLNGCTIDGSAATVNSGTSNNPAVNSITTTFNGYDLMLAADVNNNQSYSSGPTNSYTGLNIAITNYSNSAYFVTSLNALSAFSTQWNIGGSAVWRAIAVALESK